jgi:uncharacterized protein GlcG (DUF336 family)
MYTKPFLGITEVMAALNAMIAEADKEPGRPVTFAIVDQYGSLLGYVRQDNAPVTSHTVAVKKAYTAAKLGGDTLAVAERFKAMERSLADFNDPQLIPWQGGIVVTGAGGAVLGGIGVSGRRSDEDEVICKAGLAAMNLGKE